MNRAYSILTAKAFDEKSRTFKGIASTPTPDRMADIVEPKGAKYKLPLPLLSQHDHHLPIGWVKSATVTDNGIEIDGEVAEQADLDYVETAWKQLKAGLVRGLSIGFSPIKYKWIQDEKGNETGGTPLRGVGLAGTQRGHDPRKRRVYDFHSQILRPRPSQAVSSGQCSV